MSSRSSRTLYVGNLPGDIKEWEVEDLFYKYGPIVDIDLKVPPRPPGYCFIEFEDARDAEDAIRGRDGYNFDGHRIRVELAHGGRRVASSVRSSSYSNGGGGGGGGGRGGRGGGVSRRTDYRVLVSGLPSSASWQDLKDHMRQAGDVCYAEVFRDSNGTCGTVDYTNLDDMKYAVRKLDDSEFKNAFSRSYIQVREYGSKKSISRSRSRSRSRSLSNSRSRSNSRSPSHSRSIGRSNRKAARRLPSRSRSRSPSRSRTRSPSISRKVARRSPSRSISRSPSRSRPRSPSISRKVARQSSSQSRSRSPSRARLHSPSISGSKSRSLSPRRLPSAPKRPSRSISKSRSPSCS